MTSWDRFSRQQHPPRMRRPPGTLAPELNYHGVLGQLREQFPRLSPHLAAQVDSMYHTLQKVRQDLQEHHRQVSE
ncbi:Transducin-like enhancer protein 6 [Vulpes lagopus]